AFVTVGRLYFAIRSRMISFHRNTPPAAQYLILLSSSFVRFCCRALISFRSALYDVELIASGAATGKLSARERKTGFQEPAPRSLLSVLSAAVLSVRLLIFLLQPTLSITISERPVIGINIFFIPVSFTFLS